MLPFEPARHDEFVAVFKRKHGSIKKACSRNGGQFKFVIVIEKAYGPILDILIFFVCE